MTIETFLLFMTFTIPIMCSPGPVNVTLAAVGARYGVRPVIPFLIGLAASTLFFCFLVGMGLGKIFEATYGSEIRRRFVHALSLL